MARADKPQRSVGAVTILVPDYEEAIDYYVSTLGFTLTEDSRLSNERRWVLVSPGAGTCLLLAKAKGERQFAAIGNQSGGRVFLFLTTDNFWARLSHLHEPGGRVSRGAQTRRVRHSRCILGQVWQPVGPHRTVSKRGRSLRKSPIPHIQRLAVALAGEIEATLSECGASAYSAASASARAQRRSKAQTSSKPISVCISGSEIIGASTLAVEPSRRSDAKALRIAPAAGSMPMAG